MRERYGYQSELRAISDVPRDRLTYQHQVGFDAFAVNANQKFGTIPSDLFDFKPANQPATGLQHTTQAG